MNIEKIFNSFIENDEISKYDSFGNGHINRTYLIETKNHRKYVLQKINTYIFKDVDILMNNIKEVTTFLKNNGSPTIFMLTSKDGKNYYKDVEETYRMYEFIDNSLTFEKALNYEMIEDAASSYGWFHNKLADLGGSKLKETIPHFHDTPKRYSDFLNSVKLDKVSRLKKCEHEVEIVKKYENLYGLIMDGINSKEVKLHVTHNDPKINNVLFDKDTYKFKCVIDLDTVMPGSVLFDFGDALRSLMTGDREDSKEYQKVVCDFEIYKHYFSAYYKEAKNFLTKKEIELIPYAPFLLTMECAMRFLADYLDGDVYFATQREEHNLDRARTQINLAQSLIENIDKLKAITAEVIGK